MPMADEEDRLSNADLAEWKRRVHQTKWMDSSNLCAESKGNDTIIVPGEKKNTYPFIFGLCFRVAVPILGDTVSDTPPLKTNPRSPSVDRYIQRKIGFHQVDCFLSRES